MGNGYAIRPKRYHWCPLKSSPDLDSHEAVQKSSVYVHLPLLLFSSRGCTLCKFSSLFPMLILYDLQGINTTVTLVSVCQNDHFHFSFLQSTYLGIVQGITSAARYILYVLTRPLCLLIKSDSTFGFWYIQRRWKIPTKRMVGHPRCCDYSSFMR